MSGTDSAKSTMLLHQIFDVLHKHYFDGAVLEKPYQLRRVYDCFELHILCNDFFAWGLADLEPVFKPDVLEQCYVDCRAVTGENCDHEYYAPYLYVCRIRGMRPQGAVYPRDRRYWKIFDDCGPERPVQPGNPYAPGEYYRLKPGVEDSFGNIDDIDENGALMPLELETAS